MASSTTRSIPPELKIRPRRALEQVVAFLQDRVPGQKFSGIVMGISGGIDSGLGAELATEALGAQQVTGLFMPYAESDPQSEKDAEKLAKKLGIELIHQPLTPFAEAYFAARPTGSKVRKGNVLARLRMICLFDESHKSKRLVLGTSNKSEILLGYGTWYGDTACSLNALGELYKTQVRQLARYLRLPKSILEKPPTADLWPGQTDEDELGVRYEQADQILVRLFDQGKSSREVIADGFPAATVRRVIKLEKANRFKRRTPEIARIDGE